jgi:heterodisulfide reductase subunit A
MPSDAGGSILTQRQLADALTGEREWGAVVMIQCVGSRSGEHPWCSRTCCARALRNALRLKRADASTEVTILHRGVRVWGFDEELLSEAIERGVEFIEVEDTASVATDGGISVTATRVGGEPVSLRPDTVVLSVGVKPSTVTAGIADLIGAELAPDGFFNSAGRVRCGGTMSNACVHACGRASGPADLDERIVQAQAAAGKVCLYLKRGDDEA